MDDATVHPIKTQIENMRFKYKTVLLVQFFTGQVNDTTHM